MKVRLVTIAVIVIAMLALYQLADGVPQSRASVAEDPGLDGAVVASPADTANSTWFCPSGTAGTTEAVTHRVFVANPTEAALTARVVPWTAEGVAGTPVELAVPAASTIVVTPEQLGGATGSLQVELSPGGGVVSHRLVVGGLFDEGPCASRTSDVALFPAIDTRTGASARLVVFNPFRADTVLDVTVSSDDGVRVPTQLGSVVVAGGTSKTFELGEVVQKRPQFSAVVRARTGRFVSELVQVGDGAQTPKGLRMQLGVPAPNERLAFADGYVTPGLTEQYIVYNSSNEPARVALGVVPYDADPAAWPEPFLLDVPARRAVGVDLGAEPRVPQDVPHWVRLDVLSGSGVAAERLVTVGATNALGLQSGTADSTGAPRSAKQWIVSGIDSAPSSSQVSIVNPSVDSIAVVTVKSFAGGSIVDAATSPRVEIAPGHGVTIDLAAIAAGAPPDTTVGLIVTGEQPLLVERRTLGAALAALSSVPAGPVDGTLADLD